MVQFLSIIFFSLISSIFVGFFKSSRFLCVTLYNHELKKSLNKKKSNHTTTGCGKTKSFLWTSVATCHTQSNTRHSNFHTFPKTSSTVYYTQLRLVNSYRERFQFEIWPGRPVIRTDLYVFLIPRGQHWEREQTAKTASWYPYNLPFMALLSYQHYITLKVTHGFAKWKNNGWNPYAHIYWLEFTDCILLFNSA